MTEKFIHYLWKFRLFNQNLKTDTGEELTIFNPGEHNHNAGPDFLNARIRIGSTTWAGNVEIHVKSSDWFRHDHHHDDAYSNIILHVVYENDDEVYDRNGNSVPVFAIGKCYDPSIEERYLNFILNQNRIPCEAMIPELETFHFTTWAPSLAVERFMSKAERFRHSFLSSHHDWEECFYRQLARAFGFRINSDNFENLAQSLPLKIIRRHRDSAFQMEALFYGQAGLIAGSEDYPHALLHEYTHLQEKYSLIPMPSGQMRFLRLRPSNFPTIRISQFCDLLKKEKDLFSSILNAEKTADLYSLFLSCASSYWDTHFVFGKLSPSNPKHLGDSSIRLLILNFVIPFLYFYGEMKQQDLYRQRALDFLEQEPGEDNEIIGFWKTLGLPVENALHTQALLQLKNNYCDQKQCLECRIGLKLLQ